MQAPKMRAFNRDSLTIMAALALLLAWTRFDHFGPLPDASLAVFLLGGLWLGGMRAFILLFAVAFAVDLAAVGVESWRVYCLTPAYWGLLPTYAGLWLAGRWLTRQAEPLAPTRLLWFAPLVFSVAFVLSNLFWWALSPRFELTFIDFWPAVAQYWAPYVGSGLLHLTLLVLVARWALTSPRLVR